MNAIIDNITKNETRELAILGIVKELDIKYSAAETIVDARKMIENIILKSEEYDDDIDEFGGKIFEIIRTSFGLTQKQTDDAYNIIDSIEAIIEMGEKGEE